MDAVVPAKLRVDDPAVRSSGAPRRSSTACSAACCVYYLVTHDLASTVSTSSRSGCSALFGTTAMWIGLAVLLSATVFVRNLYCRFLCPVGADARHPVEPHRVPDQALVRVQHLQDLREDLRVGRDPRTEDRQDRMRALRRLRAALPGSAEVPALADHPSAQGSEAVRELRLGSATAGACQPRLVLDGLPACLSRTSTARPSATQQHELALQPARHQHLVLAVTITPSTSGSRSIERHPFLRAEDEHARRQPVGEQRAVGDDRHAAAAAAPARPVAGSRMWW